MAEFFDVPSFDLEGIIVHSGEGWALSRTIMGGHLEEIGKAVVIAHWRTGYTRSWEEEIMYQVEVKVGNLTYTGRTYGPGSFWRGRLKRVKSHGKRVRAVDKS